ncbi:MAG: RdgB/HAM1 family non-canonical purine NTP pyrophosphatase [Leptothrix ochracea]|uniref:RdgB/HAM1 family non-canonical purine NTP pyrophosphatase n=1 Tax=Leptothrix ochracea TaxID=735331 RepID=UPI0034E247D8
MELILASNNAKKLKELSALLAPLSIELISQGTLGIPEAEEPHPSFVENALAKARHAALLSGKAALADDSGLCVDALGGAPGVHSARYAQTAAQAVERDMPRETQREHQDAANNARLLSALAAYPLPAQRSARFVCALVAVRHATDPEPLIAFGRWEGRILDQLQGQGGFGYDPLMFIPTLGHTAAELPAEIKNAHSHRALAVAQLLSLMRTVWSL